MRALAFPANNRPARSFPIALGFVLVFGAAEILATAFHYAADMRAARAAARSTATVTAAPTASVAPAEAPAASVASQVAESPSSTVMSTYERLRKSAKAAQDRGDTVNAIARYQEALKTDPNNAEVLAELAMIYESMQYFDRSNETWKKIVDIGPPAGPLYELADMKLKTGVPAAPARSVGSEAASATGGEADTLADGATFGISEVTTNANADPDAETSLSLRIAVKKRPGAEIDHTKVKIQVYFYDSIDDGKIELTDAEVNYEWLTTEHDWSQTNPELLMVSYLRPKNKALASEAALSAAAAAVNPNKKTKTSKKPDTSSLALPESGHRKYLGYIVRVYYNDQLQAVRSDPPKLLNLYPSPNTASP